jgi:hypothetical protein
MCKQVLGSSLVQYGRLKNATNKYKNNKPIHKRQPELVKFIKFNSLKGRS